MKLSQTVHVACGPKPVCPSPADSGNAQPTAPCWNDVTKSELLHDLPDHSTASCIVHACKYVHLNNILFGGCLQHAAGGLLGLVIALFLEVSLFVIRTGYTPPPSVQPRPVPPQPGSSIAHASGANALSQQAKKVQ